FLNHSGACKEPISFEILARTDNITVQFAAAEKDAVSVRRHLTTFFPEVIFLDVNGGLAQAWTASSGEPAIIEFGLGREFMLPLNTNFDPFVGLIGAVSDLQPDEVALFQVIFEAVRHNWPESVER